MSLLQGIYRLKRLASLSPLPVFCQFITVQIPPFKQECDDSLRQVTLDRAVADIDRRFTTRIPRMKVRRLVLTVIDSNDDTQEPADDWHERYCTRASGDCD